MTNLYVLLLSLVVSQSAPAGGPQTRTRPVITVLPGRAIGPIALGTQRAQLPQQAAIHGEFGQLESIRFQLANHVVDDVWLEDIASGAFVVAIAQHKLPLKPTLAQLQAILGKCTPLPPRIGGYFYNCAQGIAVGVSSRGAVQQLRLKPQ